MTSINIMLLILFIIGIAIIISSAKKKKEPPIQLPSEPLTMENRPKGYPPSLVRSKLSRVDEKDIPNINNRVEQIIRNREDVKRRDLERSLDRQVSDIVSNLNTTNTTNVPDYIPDTHFEEGEVAKMFTENPGLWGTITATPDYTPPCPEPSYSPSPSESSYSSSSSSYSSDNSSSYGSSSSYDSGSSYSSSDSGSSCSFD